MKERPRPIAKLTRPAAGELLRRERLFTALDAALAPARGGKVAWVMAPAGAGKTSLAATWIEARGRASLWYALDAGDGDPASFFYYFALAARHGLDAGDLPPYGDGHRAAVGVFARRFFERVFGAADRSLVVVLDNYQELAPDAPAHEAVDALLASAPEGVSVIVSTRSPPPPRLACWLAAPGLRVVDWPALRLTSDEAAALVPALGVVPNERLDALIEASRGWAAGLVLLARGLAHGLQLPRGSESPSNAVFDYFAAEVLAKAPPALRAFVLRTAFLPNMCPAVAAEVSGEPRAGELLEELHRGQLFTERKDRDDVLYEYHPLFRDFLQAQAAAAFDPETLRGIRSASAAALEARGYAEAAAPLLVANADGRGLARVVRGHAHRLVAHGRYAILAGWLAGVPEAALPEEPWLLFWLGWCRTIDRASGVRALLARAFAAFERAGDVEGAFTSCAWLLRTSVLAEEARTWIATVERLAAAQPRFADADAEARVIAQFRAVQQFPARHPLVEGWAARAAVLARTLDDPGAKMTMAAYAMSVHLTHGDVQRLGAVAAENRALLSRTGAPPSESLLFLLFCGFHRLQVADLDEAEAILERMTALAETTGAIHDLAATWHFGCRVALFAGDLDRARDYQERLRGAGEFLPPYTQHGGTRTVYLQLLERDLDRAAATARAVLEAGEAFPAFRPVWQANHAQVMLERGEASAALAELEQAAAGAHAARLPAAAGPIELLRAAALFQLGEVEAGFASLDKGFAGARALGCLPHVPLVLPATVARLAARALERGIEREFVSDLVARWRLAPPSAEEERWPWSVRVRALGAFEIAVGGENLNGAAKAQRKPIDLLKCVIAYGGRDVSVAAMTQALWPEAEGDAAKRSFDITLHRLRRGLGRENAIVLEAGKLALNPGVVWVDSLAFERLVGRVDESLRGARATGLPPAELLDRALRLYRGPFLASDDEGWAQPVRDRLRNRYLALVERGGEFLERSERADAALACYQRAVELDPPAERIYQRIMRCLHARGRRAEALDVYRRCRNMLAATLGASPSAETEALHQLLRG